MKTIITVTLLLLNTICYATDQFVEQFAAHNQCFPLQLEFQDDQYLNKASNFIRSGEKFPEILIDVDAFESWYSRHQKTFDERKLEKLNAFGCLAFTASLKHLKQASKVIEKSYSEELRKAIHIYQMIGIRSEAIFSSEDRAESIDKLLEKLKRSLTKKKISQAVAEKTVIFQNMKLEEPETPFTLIERLNSVGNAAQIDKQNHHMRFRAPMHTIATIFKNSEWDHKEKFLIQDLGKQVYSLYNTRRNFNLRSKCKSAYKPVITSNHIRGAMLRSHALISNMSPEQVANAIGIASQKLGRSDLVYVDPSAGWGDRQVGSYYSGLITQYIGIDPNPGLQQVYPRILEGLDQTHQRPVKREFIEGCSEDHVTWEQVKNLVGDKEIDLIFTSPPYWGTEKYALASSYDNQSWHKYPSKNSWTEGFLNPLIKHSINILNKNQKSSLLMLQVSEELAVVVEECMKTLAPRASKLEVYDWKLASNRKEKLVILQLFPNHILNGNFKMQRRHSNSSSSSGETVAEWDGPVARAPLKRSVSGSSSSSGETVAEWDGPVARLPLKRSLSGSSSSSGETVASWEGPTFPKSITIKRSSRKVKRSKLQPLSIETSDKLQQYLQDLSQNYEPSQDTFLREYQKKTLVDILDCFRLGKKKIAVQMPTGTGKTALFSRLISLLQNSELPHQIIVAVPTSSLVEQTVDKLRSYATKLPSLAVEVGQWTQHDKFIAPVTVTTMQSLTSMWKKLKDSQYQPSTHWSQPDDYFHPNNPNTLVIFDEAHRTNGETISKIINKMPVSKPLIGFSASLSDYENLPLEVVSSLALHEAIQSKAISGVQFLDIDFSKHQNLDFLRKSLKTEGKDLSREQLELFDSLMSQASGISLTVAQIIKATFLESNSHRKIMVFTNTQDHADHLKRIFDAVGLKSLTIHGNMHNSEKVTNLSLYRAQTNDINIMISCGVLDEGFDLPDVKVVVDFGIYIKKPRRLVQRLGRATRLTEKLPESAKYVRVKILPDDAQSPQLNPRTIGLLGNTGEDISHLGVKDSDILAWNQETNLEPINFEGKDIQPYDVRLKFPASSKIVLLKNDGSFLEEEESEMPMPANLQDEFMVDEEFQHFLDEMLID